MSSKIMAKKDLNYWSIENCICSEKFFKMLKWLLLLSLILVSGFFLKGFSTCYVFPFIKFLIHFPKGHP